MNPSSLKIAHNFDAAAAQYDRRASVQAEAAQQLVARALPITPPHDILDLGCGTGFVATTAAHRWPKAQITALDHAPAMLQQAQLKIPQLKIITGNAAETTIDQRFDIIFSSMMLHWLPQPLEALQRWRTWLKPGGYLYVALLGDGSFHEWRDLCRNENINDGLWRMPSANFADSLGEPQEEQSWIAVYPSAQDFLHQLKFIGAATPRNGYKPLNSATMRRLLALAPRPFNVTYHILFVTLKAL